MKAGQMIYKVDANGEQTPYIVYGVDEDEDVVFAISIHNQTYSHNERIRIELSKIDNFCFSLDDAFTNIDGDDYKVVRDALNKNEKHIKKHLKKHSIK